MSTLQIIACHGGCLKTSIRIAAAQQTKAELRHAFSACVYYMLLRFHIYYVGLSQPVTHAVKTHVEKACGNEPQVFDCVDKIKFILGFFFLFFLEKLT